MKDFGYLLNSPDEITLRQSRITVVYKVKLTFKVNTGSILLLTIM